MNTLRQSIAEYLEMRRSLGFKMQEAGALLPDFATFMERRGAAYITQALAVQWATRPKYMQPPSWAGRLCHVRQFARYRRAIDPRTQVPALGLLPFKPKRATPYLYTDKEIRQLLQTTLHVPLTKHRGTCALQPWVYYCLFGLLCVSGLRLGEARNLTLDDVDLKAGVITVRSGKLGKDRWVPLHASTCEVLTSYLDRRNRYWAGRCVSEYFFVSSRGNRLDASVIHRAFYAASRRIGLRGAHESKGPRLHDLRHRFATTALLNWYRMNDDPERRLPILSAYLGHVRVADTQWYLSASPELMNEAMRRLEHRWRKES
jgi:integrase